MATTTVTQTETVGPSNRKASFVPSESRKSQDRIQLQEINARNEVTRELSQDLPAPSIAGSTLERWNSPRSNVFCLMGTFVSFFILGLTDATPGALIPYLERYYDLSYTVVSLIFLPPVVGYSAAAALNNTVHRKFGQRGIAIGASVCHIVPFLTFSFHPPWPVIVVMYIIVGFGNGLSDAAWCAWTGNMVSANKVQGFLQSCYSLGGMLSPLIATTMIVQGGLQWYTWYYVMTGASVVEFVVCSWAFWHKDGVKYRSETHDVAAGTTTWQAVKNKVTIICAMIFLTYVGAEVALGGWVVTFMLRVRNAGNYAAGISGTGFWAGMTVGRAVLGFVTERFGERLCVTVYLACAIALELVFWLVPEFVVSAVAVAFLGFFLGPIFPGGIVMCAKLLPKHMHVAAVGAATALAGVGGAGIPFAVGALAQVKGVWVLQPVVLSLLVVIAILWLSLPRVKKRD